MPDSGSGTGRHAPIRRRFRPEWLIALVLVAALLMGARDRGPGQDEGVWTLVARAWVDDGVPPYQGPIDNKPPGIFYVFAITYALAGTDYRLPRLLGVLAALGTCAVLYALGRRFGGRLAGALAALAAGLVLASPSLGGRVATESFMGLLTALAVRGVVAGGTQPPRRRRLSQIGAGVLLGLAVAFKQVAVLVAPALVAWTWAVTPAGERTARRAATDAALMAAGAALGVAISLLPLLVAGVTVAEYWQGAWVPLLDPGSARYPLAARLPNVARLLDYPLVVLTAAAMLAAVAAPRPLRVPLALWAAAGVLAAAVSGHFAGHQLRALVPPGALGLGLLASQAGSSARCPGRVAVFLAASVTVALMPYQPVLNLALGRPPQRHYAAHEDVGTWVRAATGPDDLVFGWVSGGVMQTVAERRSPSRHVNANLAGTPAAVAEVSRDLAARPPRVIVVQDGPPDWLARVLAGDYTRVLERGSLAVYERRAALPAPPPAARR